LLPGEDLDERVSAPIPLPEWPAPPAPAGCHGLAGEVVRAIEPGSDPVRDHCKSKQT
jgi:hypothetical protein